LDQGGFDFLYFVRDEETRMGSTAFIRNSIMRKILCCALAIFAMVSCVLHCRAQALASQQEVSAISEALRGRNFTEALRLSQAALAQRPNDSRIWTLRGMAAAGTGNLPQALAAYRHALKLAPTYLPALEGAAQSEFQMGQDAAKPLLLEILAQRPGDPTSSAMLAVIEYRSKNCSDAVVHFQNAVAVISSQPAALTEYGSCLAILNRDEDAISVFAQVLVLDSNKSEARYNLALAQLNARHPEDALTTLQPSIESASVDAEASMLAAEILESNGETARSVELLRKAILADPKNVDAYLQFAALSFDHASPQVGIDILNAGLTQLPNEPRLFLVRGILQTQLGEFARAAEDFEKASRLDPLLSFLGVAQGLVKSQQHMSAEALDKFRSAVKAHPNEAYAQYLLAEALEEEGAPAGSPRHNEELEAARRAVQLDPRMVAAHDLLSAIYYDDEQTNLAIEQSRASLALDPNDQQAIYHLIVALRKTDRKDQIPALLKRMIELRSNAGNGQKASKQYRLYETPAPAAAPSTQR
jgi:tetratricopeptide (TPR) repeat protein